MDRKFQGRNGYRRVGQEWSTVGTSVDPNGRRGKAGLEGVRHLVAQMKTTPDSCRSELAREEPEGTTLIQHKRGALKFFASKLAPTVKRVAAPGRGSGYSVALSGVAPSALWDRLYT